MNAEHQTKPHNNNNAQSVSAAQVAHTDRGALGSGISSLSSGRARHAPAAAEHCSALSHVAPGA